MSSKLIERFHSIDPSDANYWRAINLFGRNVASYKFSLAKSLLELAEKQISAVTLEDLADPFSRHLCDHIKVTPKQITNKGNNEFLTACKDYNDKKIHKTSLIDTTKRLGFKYVLDAFHIVNGKEIDRRFFVDERKSSKRILITDALFELGFKETGLVLLQETEARWRLVETSWTLGISRNLIKADVKNDLLYSDQVRRTDVTSCRDGLNGYQKSKCFYCFQEISVVAGTENLCDVDHFFPFDLKKKNILNSVDGLWNLVLSCKDCNRGKKGKFNLIPSRRFLKRLDQRNEYYISSHDPLRDTILSQTGKLEAHRRSFLQQNFNLAKSHLIHEWSPRAQNAEDF